MGVKDLWNILSPLSERKPLFELQGKAIAIDLSCWIVDSQSVTDNIAQPKMHLRNLFFRTSYFLLHDIFPVFVLEGAAPTLKHNTIVKRNDIRHGRETKKTNKKAGRSRFNYVLKECEEMLKYMGLTCVKGYGEAEAMCAYLNEDGLVDGCISQDSDCLLYGAKVVYRNFCTSTQGNRTTSSGSIDEYSMEKIQQVFNLGRNKMIALALICGCDYDEGLSGVGKEAALKLFKIVDDDEILNRMKQWRTDTKFKRMEAELSNPDICTNCGHPGKMRSHTKVGCVDCGTKVKCSDSYKEKRTLISNELAIRKKALIIENFPNQELIDEFLVRKGPVPSELDLKWKKPMIVKFVGFMEKNVAWEPAYAFAKIFPLVTRWQLLNLIEFPIEQRLTTPGVFVPEKIKKIRNIKSVASYEILWLDRDDILEGLTLTSPESNREDDEEESPDALSELATIEPQEIVRKCYPMIVVEFDTQRNAKKKKSTRSRKNKTDENSEEPTEKKKSERKRRGKSKTAEIASNRKIIEFVKVEKQVANLEESLGRMSITPKRRKKNEPIRISSVKKRGPQFDRVMTTERMDAILNGSLEAMFNQLTPEDFASDLEDSTVDMSFIINEICSKKTNEQNICIEYQENISPNTDFHMKYDYSVVKDSEIEHESGFVKNVEENIVIEHQESVLKPADSEEELDEFDLLEKTYVPLHMRLDVDKRKSRIPIRKSLTTDNTEDRFSIGIDSLLNGTDD
ncbi:hypothetical protein TSAR_005298 [Trichomalopsis sarcophagae]|uniref:XPG-I domain-containing protein n=1 Tax=Trichomalopsis sarcophagae TaxID=543379 RepID=A0A232ESP6_9HYME|nr:hypothetical protein TSAR_005298 [Trichomalopsis sarcophagae]